MTREEQIQVFAELLETEQLERMDKEGFTHHRQPIDDSDSQSSWKASVKSGRKYVKVDFNGSGWLMIDGDEIFGIKAYGVIHRGHYYCTLDEIHDWYWGDYSPRKKKS